MDDEIKPFGEIFSVVVSLIYRFEGDGKVQNVKKPHTHLFLGHLAEQFINWSPFDIRMWA